MEGLLNKALRLRGGLQKFVQKPAGNTPDDTPADTDQEEIKRQIELAIAQNKIRVTPELFSFKARNSGILMPLLVNAGTLLVLTIGISILALVFANQQQQQERVSIQLKSAEGSVIAELKKEADAKMAAKEQEIEDINKRLSDIASQRDNLASNMATTIKQREAQLRAIMQTELENERQRLKALGLGTDEINKRMKIFEKQKTDEFNAKLAAFRKQADEDRQRTEDRLRAQEAAFSQNLVKANQDRAGLLADSQKREEELRHQLQAQQNQASAQSNLSQTQLAQAEAQMRKLAQVRDQEKIMAAQIAGFYLTLREQINTANWAKATDTVALLKTFLNSPPLMEMESMKQRRETELFVADSLLNLIEKERNPPVIDGTLTTAGSGDASTNQGSFANQEALAAALKTAQDQAKADLEKVQKEADAVQKRLLDQKDAELAKQLKQQASTLNAEMDGLKKTIREQTTTIVNLQASIVQQKADLEAARNRADKAESDLKLVSNGQSADLLANQRTLELRVAALDKDNKDLVSKLTSGQTDLGDAKKTIAANQQERRDLSDKLDAVNRQMAKMQTDGARDRVLAQDYDAMTKSWNDYLKTDAARTSQKPAADSTINNVVRGKVLFDTFLAGENFKKAFPGLYDRVHALDQANYAAGKDSVLPGLADKIYSISSFGTRVDRLAHLQAEISKATDSASKEFYQNLYDLMNLEDK